MQLKSITWNTYLSVTFNKKWQMIAQLEVYWFQFHLNPSTSGVVCPMFWHPVRSSNNFLLFWKFSFCTVNYFWKHCEWTVSLEIALTLEFYQRPSIKLYIYLEYRFLNLKKKYIYISPWVFFNQCRMFLPKTIF